jgi:hypothetical protein
MAVHGAAHTVSTRTPSSPNRRYILHVKLFKLELKRLQEGTLRTAFEKVFQSTIIALNATADSFSAT